MSEFKRTGSVILAALTLSVARSSSAALIRTYDLDTLCYKSSDVVVATLTRDHVPGKQPYEDRFTAAVVDPIEGQYHTGDTITSLDLDLYDPAENGQRCILFLQHQEMQLHSQTPVAISPPWVEDMLLIDSKDHVRRYYQWMDPGGLLAEGYSMPFGGKPMPNNSDTDEAKYPTLSTERSAIVARWTAIDGVRPLLSHEAQQQDVPALMDQLRERRKNAPTTFSFQNPVDGVSEVICKRLAGLHDPKISLDAMAVERDESGDWLSGLTISLTNEKGLSYVEQVVADPGEDLYRRLAAVEVTSGIDGFPGISKESTLQAHETITKIGLSDTTPEPLRLAIISKLNPNEADAQAALAASYRRATTDELQFTIEKACDFAPGDPTNSLYKSLNSACGPVISIVRISPTLAKKPGFIGLRSEIVRTKATEGVQLAHDYVFTNTATTAEFRVDLGDRNGFGDEIEEKEVPLPTEMPAGKYKIALEFFDGSKKVSTGHSITEELP